jgi:hypothetical protein
MTRLSPDIRGRDKNDDPLREAVSALRARAREHSTLANGTREAILRETMAPTEERAEHKLSRLFPRVSWRALAWSAPLLMVAVLVVPAGLRESRKPGLSDPHPNIRVAKVDGKVVFTIENGGRAHQVSKSTDPMRFDPTAMTSVTDGSFEDSATDGPSLVFYRID